MKNVRQWLDEYSQSHRNTVNQKLHFVCIPLILFSVFCALKAIPLGNAWLNAAGLTAAAALVYYSALSWRLAVGILVVFAAFYMGALAIESMVGPHLIRVALAIFVLGWIGQFAGHRVERARPSFFKDVQFLLIGPLWELAHLYDKLGIPIDGATREVSARP